jgi:hypothetical protein
MRGNLLRSAAFAIVGGVLFNATPAYADWPTFDAITHFLITQMQNAVTNAVTKVENAVTNIGNLISDKILNLDTDLNDVISRGFTQQSNYQKAAVGAQMQIADASNAAMAQVNRDTRNAQIVSEHTINPEQCVALDNGQGGVAASVAAVSVARSIGAITDNRGEALKGQPAYLGQAQAVQAINQLHWSRYCSQTEEDATLCTMTPLANADQHSWNLFGGGNLTDQDGINAANDYATNLVQPIVPAALRADQLASVTGQDASARRRSYKCAHVAGQGRVELRHRDPDAHRHSDPSAAAATHQRRTAHGPAGILAASGDARGGAPIQRAGLGSGAANNAARLRQPGNRDPAGTGQLPRAAELPRWSVAGGGVSHTDRTNRGSAFPGGGAHADPQHGREIGDLHVQNQRRAGRRPHVPIRRPRTAAANQPIHLHRSPSNAPIVADKIQSDPIMYWIAIRSTRVQPRPVQRSRSHKLRPPEARKRRQGFRPVARQRQRHRTRLPRVQPHKKTPPRL